MVVDLNNVLNAGRDKTTNIIFHDFGNHFDFGFFLFLYQPALKVFFNKFEITYISQCLIIRLYVIFVRILSTSLYLTHDSVCDYTFSYRKIQLKRRIEIILEPFIRAPFWCDPVSFLQWRAEIGIFNAKMVKYPFTSKYLVNACPRNLNKFYTICCMFLLLLICADDIELNPGPEKTIPLIIFLFAIGILTVLRHIIFLNCIYWKLIM